MANTVVITLVSRNNEPRISYSSLKWAFWDSSVPSSISAAPTAKGSVATTNTSGVCTLDVTGTALSVGQTGWLVITDSDGTYNSASHFSFAGPVRVS